MRSPFVCFVEGKKILSRLETSSEPPGNSRTPDPPLRSIVSSCRATPSASFAEMVVAVDTYFVVLRARGEITDAATRRTGRLRTLPARALADRGIDAGSRPT